MKVFECNDQSKYLSITHRCCVHNDQFMFKKQLLSISYGITYLRFNSWVTHRTISSFGWERKGLQKEELILFLETLKNNRNLPFFWKAFNCISYWIAGGLKKRSRYVWLLFALNYWSDKSERWREKRSFAYIIFMKSDGCLSLQTTQLT